MHKKNIVFTFCLACIPGAGQMYLGYLKRGASLMSLFAAVCGVTVLFEFVPLSFALPIIFAYAFFDTFRLRNQTPEQAAENPDDFAGYVKWLIGDDARRLLETRHKLLGWGCIAIGAYLAYRMLFSGMLYNLFDYIGMYWMNGLIRQIPSLVLALALVLLGVYLLRGHKSSATPNDDYVAFTGEKRDE